MARSNLLTRTARTITHHHEKQLIAIKETIDSIHHCLEANQITEALYSATMVTQCGAVPVAVTPTKLRRQTLDRMLTGPTPYAVMTVGGDIRLLPHGASLSAGPYILVFGRGRGGWETRIIDPDGATAAVFSNEQIARQPLLRGEDPVRKAKQILKKEKINIKVVDIEVQFGGGVNNPSIVSASFLVFSWELFEDPPIPFL